MNFGFNILVLFTFWVCLTATIASPHLRKKLLQRNRWEWVIDTSGLIFQGLMVPFLQIAVVAWLCDRFWPDAKASWSLPGGVGFLLSFVVVDYIFYWNHRLLHQKAMFPAHIVHHTAQQQDLLITARNTLWTPLIIVYMWINGAMVHVLSDSTWYLLGVALTAALDLWRHTTFVPKSNCYWFAILRRVLITPLEHAHHHGRGGLRTNFGANFAVWDKLHGTYQDVRQMPVSIGLRTSLGGWRMWLMPFAFGGSKEHEKA